ncbi:sensor histidine kinase [Actinospica robiniae]|uniref:sensor histidine kinase n=1 Tax=Actinospica robiniae TaxID=304901 RepID=UPI00040D9B63|nr:histidine kinase [Actinospica robiniae]
MTSLAATLPRQLVRAVNRLPPLAVDAVVVLVSECALMWGVTSSNTMNIRDGLGPWPWWIFPLAALLPIPLLWRRRAPFLVLYLSGMGLVALAIPYNLAVTYNHSSQVMLYIAMVSVAYYCDGFKFWFTALVCVGMNLVVVDQSFGKAVISALVTVMMFVAGRLAAQQRDLARLMADRAHEAEQTVEARAAQAAAEERTRIARDMHDILAHAVSLMIVQAEAGAAVVQQDAKKAEKAFDAISDGGRDALAQLRRMLGVLRDGDALALTPQPTVAELPRLVDTLRSAKIDVRMVVEGAPAPLPPDTEVAVYRTVQEAFTNMLKHARAERAELRLDWSAQALTVRVTDDGAGPKPGTPGRGLIGIRERIEACGGTVHTGPGVGGAGFEVLVRVPAAAG